MNIIKEFLSKEIANIVASEPYNLPDFSEKISNLFTKPKDPEHGDIALPCFIIAKNLKKSPQDLAEQLTESLKASESLAKFTRSINRIGPFINFVLNPSNVSSLVYGSILNGTCTKVAKSTGENIMVEYSQPNTHKAFHVGHIRSATLGNTLARLLEFEGHNVIPVNYLGDEGTHVAKCLWNFKYNYKGDIPSENRGEFLGKLYVEGTKLLSIEEMSDVPQLGIKVAKITSTKEHPNEPKWLVLNVNDGTKDYTVITNELSVKTDQIIALATPGTKIGGRVIKVADRKGVSSEGMLCGKNTLGISEENILLTFDNSVPLGTEIADLFPSNVWKESSLADSKPSEVLRERQAQVSLVLQKLEEKEPEMFKLWEETKQWSMEEFYKDYEWLNCDFDHYFFESEFGESGKVLTKEFQRDGVFIESDGAIGADLNDKKLGFCILIKSDGTATYACRDLALAKEKFNKYKIDRSYYVVDAGQKLHFQQVFECLKRMGFKQAEKCIHYDYAQVVIPGGKMSSRKGTVILFSELKSSLLDKINTEFLDKYKDEWSEEEINKASKAIALATIRYGFLKLENNSIITFDLNEWISKSGNTGPYLLYAHARMASILNDAPEGILSGEENLADTDLKLLAHDTEKNLAVHLATFREVTNKAANNCAPNLVCTFLYELCKRFNRFYRDCSVLNAESKELIRARLALISSTQAILKKGLEILGIEAIDKM